MTLDVHEEMIAAVPQRGLGHNDNLYMDAITIDPLKLRIWEHTRSAEFEVGQVFGLLSVDLYVQ